MSVVLRAEAPVLCPVPARVLAGCGLAGAVVMVLAALAALPLWTIVSVGLLAWTPVLRREVAWTLRRDEWMALFLLLAATQAGHVAEHVAQLVQIHLLGLHGLEARGVFGALDLEWVHFVWNTWVLVALTALVWHFRDNGWLWVALVFSVWHETEHIVLLARYLAAGVAGSPGLLARGGALGGGLPLARADLHFLYNLVETVPLVVALVRQLKVVAQPAGNIEHIPAASA